MPPKKCSNRAPVSQRETNPLTCFKKGIKVGVRLQAQRQAKPPLATMTIRQLADVARTYRIPNYGMLRKAQLIEALQARGYPLGG